MGALIQPFFTLYFVDFTLWISILQIQSGKYSRKICLNVTKKKKKLENPVMKVDIKLLCEKV